ncbi:MAG: phosphoribosylaminoimidazole carboxylase [Verrucomicrobiota bacterium]
MFTGHSRKAFEEFIPLLEGTGFRLEKIVSHGQPTAPGEWYDQANPEWVLLACGHAVLKIAPEDLLPLQAGDFLLIPASLRHRVESCSHDALWLALHLQAPASSPETEGNKLP